MKRMALIHGAAAMVAMSALSHREEDAREAVRTQALMVGGVFHIDHIRDGEVIDHEEVKNLVVNQGLDYILAAAFGTVAPITTWYLAPFTNNYTPTGTDTAASIARNAGEATNYTASTRVPYTPVEGGQQVTNSASPATFTFNGAGNIYGAFLISSQAQGSTAGTLLAGAQFGSLKAVADSDQLVLTYTFSAASA